MSTAIMISAYPTLREHKERGKISLDNLSVFFYLPQNLGCQDLRLRFGVEADQNENHERNQVNDEGYGVGHPESEVEGTAEHDVDASRPEDGADHHHGL